MKQTSVKLFENVAIKDWDRNVKMEMY